MPPKQVETALAEMAFYRLLFFAESPDTPFPANAADYTAFSVELTSRQSIDLTAAPLVVDAAQWTDPVTYESCQALAESARSAGIDLIRYQSVRDPARRANLAVLNCTVFSSPAPTTRQTWKIRLSPTGVQALRAFPPQSLEFTADDFGADPRVKGWGRGA